MGAVIVVGLYILFNWWNYSITTAKYPKHIYSRCEERVYRLIILEGDSLLKEGYCLSTLRASTMYLIVGAAPLPPPG